MHTIRDITNFKEIKDQVTSILKTNDVRFSVVMEIEQIMSDYYFEKSRDMRNLYHEIYEHRNSFSWRKVINMFLHESTSSLAYFRHAARFVTYLKQEFRENKDEKSIEDLERLFGNMEKNISKLIQFYRIIEQVVGKNKTGMEFTDQEIIGQIISVNKTHSENLKSKKEYSDV